MSPKPHPLPDAVASSARRRLLVRGGLKAAPLAMTVVGASAFGQTAVASSVCLTRQPGDPATARGTSFVSVPIVTFGNGANSTDFLSGAALGAIATAQGTALRYSGHNGVSLGGNGYVALRVGSGSKNEFAGVAPGTVLDSSDTRFANAGRPKNTGSVFVRIDAWGNVTGFFYPGDPSIGGRGGTALSVSCQSSFASRLR